MSFPTLFKNRVDIDAPHDLLHPCLRSKDQVIVCVIDLTRSIISVIDGQLAEKLHLELSHCLKSATPTVTCLKKNPSVLSHFFFLTKSDERCK